MLWAGIVIVGVLFGPVTPAEARRAAEEVFKDKKIERRWSDERRPPEPERDPGPSSGGPRRPPPAGPPPEPDRTPAGPTDSSSPVSAALLWILLGLGLAFVLFQVVRAWRGPAARDVRAPGAPASPRTETGPYVPPPDAAAVLAAEGRYAEAVHTLLLMALAAVGRRAYHDASLTSREVAAASALGAGAGPSLAALVRAVEVSRFGGRALTRADYEASREHLERVTAALAGSAA